MRLHSGVCFDNDSSELNEKRQRRQKCFRFACLIVEQPIDIFDPDVVRSCLAVDHFTDEEKIDRHTITRRQVQWVDNFVIAKHVDGKII